MREPLLGDGDMQRLGPGVAVNFALLAVQKVLAQAATSLARLCPTYDETSRREVSLPGWEMFCR
jgi:hypothetical protein